MTYNNTVILKGNLKHKVKLCQTATGKSFGAVTLETNEFYLDKNQNWVRSNGQNHSLLAYSSFVIDTINALKKGTRVKAEGHIEYRPFKVTLDDGQVVEKQEALIILNHIARIPGGKSSK